MNHANHFTDLYQAVQRELGWTEKQVADYLGFTKASRWRKKNGEHVNKRDILCLAALLGMERRKGYRKYRKLFWEIADVK